MYVIAGLGNPGTKYAHTRHNAGFDALDVLADRYKIRLDQNKFKGLYGTGYIEGQKVLLLKPQTFMNLSGECIRDVLNFYKIDPEEELIVLYDDISLEPGLIRIRKKGSAGGHNGIKNIILHTNTQNFKRVKIGVGEKPKEWDLVDYVLGGFSPDDRKKLEEAFDHTVDAVELITRDETDEAMNRYNKKNKQEEKKAPRSEQKTAQTDGNKDQQNSEKVMPETPDAPEISVKAEKATGIFSIFRK